MWEELLDVLQISIRHSLGWCSLRGQSRLIRGQQKGLHICRSMTCLNIQTIVQFCRYSLTCLWHVGHVWMAWPSLSIKLDFWCHGCALFHLEAAILEERGQAFKCISWFKLNSVIKGREIKSFGWFAAMAWNQPTLQGSRRTRSHL